jgi:parallel beta-helix repeat protein
MSRTKAYSVAVFLVLLLAVHFRLSCQMSTRASAVIRVPDDCPTIQEGVNRAYDGDTVFVSAGTYYEHIVVNKSISLIGENRDTTIVDGNGSAFVISIKVDNVAVSGFTAQNGTMSGILLTNCSNCRIENNIVTLNVDSGIRLDNSSANLVRNNEIFNNGYFIPGWATGLGIYLGWWSCNNIISSNHVYDNMAAGISMDGSYTNLLCDNNVTNQHAPTAPYGIMVFSSRGNVVQTNAISNNSEGIWVWCSSYNMLLENEVFDNGYNEDYDYGIEINRSANNTIVRNHILNNTRGISVEDEAPNNLVVCNTISNNGVGAHTHYSNDSVFCKNNFVRNKMQASVGDFYPDVNAWDNGAEGNYWSGFTGPDADLDGIIDSPYVLDVRNRDSFPLVAPWSETRTHTAAWDGTVYAVTTWCNSTVAGFSFSQPNKHLSFNVTGPANSTGVCNVTVPLSLMWGYFSILIDNVPQAYAIYQNATHTSIYFTVLFQSTRRVRVLSTGVVPENPLLALISVFVALSAVLICLKRTHAQRHKRNLRVIQCAKIQGIQQRA